MQYYSYNKETVLFIYKENNCFTRVTDLMEAKGCRTVVAEAVLPDVFSSITESKSVLAVICAQNTDPKHVRIMVSMLFERYCRSVFLITGLSDMQYYTKLKKEYQDLHLLNYPFSERVICVQLDHKLNELGYRDKYREELKVRIMSFLYKLGFVGGGAGMRCAAEGIYYIIQKDMKPRDISSEIMPYIADKCGCTEAAADQAIRSERRKILSGSREQKARAIFPRYFENEKQNNATLLFSAAGFIKEKDAQLITFCGFDALR
ncbi:MAG: hypothetical protein IKP95_08975 [Ruminococcus sp.]|nr:hypothetical protein [Ruminococcus sp.]